MKKIRIASAVGMAALCLAIMSVPAAAATKITAVSVEFEAEGYDEEGFPEVSAEVKGQHYSVDNVYAAYYDTEDGDDYDVGTDVYMVELSADEGYYFSSTKSSNIHLSGLGAEFVKASRDNDNESMKIQVKLPKAYDTVEEIDSAAWIGGGRGSWDAAMGAKYYIVSLIDGNGKSKQAETYGTSYDFKPFMLKPGNYTFRVRPVSFTERKGDWMESSSSCYVSSEEAAENSKAYTVDVVVTYKDDIVKPDNQIITYRNVGWQVSSSGKYWYRNQDGSYLQEMWLLDGGSWYYFGADGYMLTDAYYVVCGQQYYFDTEGRMVTSAKVPDGRTAGADGALPAK